MKWMRIQNIIYFYVKYIMINLLLKKTFESSIKINLAQKLLKLIEGIDE